MAWRVLVADANKKYRKMMDRSLGKWGYHSILCTDGQTALAKLAEETDIFLVVVDWHLTEMSGATLCLEMRRIIQRPLYVIALNGQISRADIANGLKAGINGYLPKPIPLADFQSQLAVGCSGVAAILGHKLPAASYELQAAQARGF